MTAFQPVGSFCCERIEPSKARASSSVSPPAAPPLPARNRSPIKRSRSVSDKVRREPTLPAASKVPSSMQLPGVGIMTNPLVAFIV